MQDNPLWISITELMLHDIQPFIPALSSYPDFATYIQRLTAVRNIQQRELHIEQIVGKDKDINVIVDIFNKVNSGGTRLSKGDLALATVCAEWPDARSEMQKMIARWRQSNFQFRLDWLLRCVNTVTTGEALFDALGAVSAQEFKAGLEKAQKHIDYLLNLISSRLGLDHDRVLGSKYAFPLMVRYLDQYGGHIANAQAKDRLLF